MVPTARAIGLSLLAVCTLVLRGDGAALFLGVPCLPAQGWYLRLKVLTWPSTRLHEDPAFCLVAVEIRPPGEERAFIVLPGRVR